MSSSILLFDLLSPSFTSCVIKMEIIILSLFFLQNFYNSGKICTRNSFLHMSWAAWEDWCFILKMGENADKVSMITLLSAYSSTCCFYCLILTSPTYLQCQEDQIGSLSSLFSENEQTLFLQVNSSQNKCTLRHRENSACVQIFHKVCSKSPHLEFCLTTSQNFRAGKLWSYNA